MAKCGSMSTSCVTLEGEHSSQACVQPQVIVGLLTTVGLVTRPQAQHFSHRSLPYLFHVTFPEPPMPKWG